MTNLLIGYPQITTSATVTTSSAFATAKPKERAIYGSRSEGVELAAAATSMWMKFDLGSSQTKTIDFLYVARAKLLKSRLSTRLLLEGSTDDISYSDVCGVDGGFQSLALYGPRSEDAIFTEALGNSTDGTLPASPSCRYWRFWGAGAADPSELYQFSKVIFGQWFDMGREPRSDMNVSLERSPWNRDGRLVFNMRWEGISKATKDSFVSTFVKEAGVSKVERGLFLYTDTNHAPLLGYRVLHAVIAAYEAKYRTEGFFDLSVTFKELI